MPVITLIVAIAVLVLIHSPPAEELLSVVVRPAHKIAVPVTGDGNGLTNTVVVVKQPVGNV
jgi:hypothetical protein